VARLSPTDHALVMTCNFATRGGDDSERGLGTVRFAILAISSVLAMVCHIPKADDRTSAPR
jgi:hypothetical protein